MDGAYKFINSCTRTVIIIGQYSANIVSILKIVNDFFYTFKIFFSISISVRELVSSPKLKPIE